MTSVAADQSVLEKEKNDEDELLSFAESLDFDRYIEDMEVRTIMDGLRHRIAEMEKEVGIDEKREGASEERQAKREALSQMVSLYRSYFYELLLKICFPPFFSFFFVQVTIFPIFVCMLLFFIRLQLFLI